MTTAPQTTRPPRWVWRFGVFAVRIFYRIERVGPDPPSGALLLVANHPNTRLDPAVVQATAGRHVHFLAKPTLFKNHPVSLLVRHLGAIPVYRRIDAGVETARNVEMFRAVETALANSKAICLFPEGISHDSGRLATLRTGAARMALTSSAKGHTVSIIAVGLNFERLARFRSRVTAVFGHAFDCADLLDAYRREQEHTARELTERIGDHLRGLMIEAAPREDLPLVARIDRLYASACGVSMEPQDRIARRQLIADGMDQLRLRDPERLSSVLTRVREYDADLQRFGLRDRDVEQRISLGTATRFSVREGLLALGLALLAAASLVALRIAVLDDWTAQPLGAGSTEPGNLASGRRCRHLCRVDHVPWDRHRRMVERPGGHCRGSRIHRPGLCRLGRGRARDRCAPDGSRLSRPSTDPAQGACSAQTAACRIGGRPQAGAGVAGRGAA